MAGGFRIGERVRWNTPQGDTTGYVVDRRVEDFRLARRKFTATPDDPAYVVESERSGKRAAHRESALARA